ncbi:O-methyltransferase [Aminipila luticellarii]|uniref:O-methyltransferase n=1 Tax=Aminipila luticellarii TaxID=2507160 RepID=A0A410PV90_9FIRM|nr:O-methyltransferase [Aminipila luticellarii]QAT42869.1 O-methyltransferase [Aminipila luticellarii]
MNITNNKVTQYIDELYKPLNISLGLLRKQAEAARVPIILRDTETLILNLIRMKQPQRILEIGTAVGYSSSCFAAAYEETKIVTIEYNEETCQTARDNIELLGLSDRITVYLGDGEKVIEQLYEKGIEPFDMVFIDASKSHYKRFWDAAIRLVQKDAVILSDNVLMKAMTVSDEYDVNGRHKTNIRKMREYVQYINALDYCHTSVVPVGDGLAISMLHL